MGISLGLDIGSHSIKLVELARDGKNLKLLTAGSILAPAKSATANLTADLEALAVVIKKLINDTGCKSRNVNIALPEAEVFTRVIEMPSLSSRELASALQWEAEQYIPLPLSEVNLDYSILRDVKTTGINKMDVLLVACPKTLLERYLKFLELAGLFVDNVETEIIAVTRALNPTLTRLPAALIVSLGAQTTDLAIIRAGVLNSIRSVSAGGNAVSRALSQTLGLELGQAEEFKKTYGLEKDKMEGKIVAAAFPVINIIISEIARAIGFYQEKHPGEILKTLILTGGTAKTPGLVKYLVEQIGGSIEVQLANPWLEINKDTRFNVLENEGSTFTVAVGLALH